MCLKDGAGNESRTRDLNLGKVALYQLSYSRPDSGFLPYPAEKRRYYYGFAFASSSALHYFFANGYLSSFHAIFR